jgi:hypothetical protein
MTSYANNDTGSSTEVGFSLRLLGSPLLITIPSLVETHLTLTLKVPWQQHVITSSVFKFGASSLTQHLGYYRVSKFNINFNLKHIDRALEPAN